MENRNDLRTQRTELFIKNAFLHLLDEQPFEKIQINDIAHQAMINRSTFYLHYRDKYDLLEKLTKQLIEEIGSFSDSLTREMVLACHQEHTPLPHLLALLSYVEMQPAFFQLASSRDPEFYQRITQSTHQKLLLLFPELRIHRLSSAYGHPIMAAVLQCVISQWIQRNMSESKEEMALLLTRILLAGKPVLEQNP